MTYLPIQIKLHKIHNNINKTENKTIKYYKIYKHKKRDNLTLRYLINLSSLRLRKFMINNCIQQHLNRYKQYQVEFMNNHCMKLKAVKIMIVMISFVK